MNRKSAELVFHYLLARRADAAPDKALLRAADRSLSYADVQLATNAVARGLAELGVRKGDTVLVMLPSGIDFVLLWLGLCKIGAIMAPMNEAYKGNVLLHQINDSAARVMVVHARFLPRLLELVPRLEALKHLVLVDATDADRDAARRHWTVSEVGAIFDQPTSSLPAVVEYDDPMAIFYTSGTTGPSKGVLYGYAQAHATCLPFARNCNAEDVFYQFLPMHHVVLPNCVGLVLVSGSTMVLRERFSLNRFWPDVRRYGVTTTLLLGAVANFVHQAPEDPDDGTTTLRKVFMVPLLKELDDFRRRFRCEVFTWFNMTEVSTPIHSDGFRLVNNRSCGRVRAGVTARIVDDRDEPVPPGVAGELVIRTEEPWELNLGYWRNAEKTVEAWRNLWFHTGDLFMQDEDGNFYFIDRLKDAIRRRGENVSSFEVEEEVNAHPAILESAAVAVPSELAEDEIAIVVVPKPGEALSPPQLLDYLQPRMPYHMVPRYVRILPDELPKTPTGKVQKNLLRAMGTDGCWDREAAGYKVQRS